METPDSQNTWSAKERVLILNTPASKGEITNFLSANPLPNVDKIFFCDDVYYKDLNHLYDECFRIVTEENVSIVISASDSSALVHSALVKTFPSLRGPSFESVFIGCHKYYSRNIAVPEQSNLKFSGFIANDHCNDQIENVLSLPAIIKPCLGTFSMGVHLIRNKNELKKMNQKIHNMPQLVKATSGFTTLVERFLDLKTYPLALEPRMTIVEEYVPPDSLTKVVSVDGFLSNGKIVPWCITDNIYWKHRPAVFKGLSVPTTLEEETQKKIWHVYTWLAETMGKHGFNDQFLDMECFVIGEEQKIKVMEINPRMFRMMAPVFHAVLDDGNVYKASLQLAKGVQPPKPVLKQNIHGIKFYITTLGEGKASEFLDFEKARQYPNVEFVTTKDTIVVQSGEAGVNLAFVTIVAKNYEQCELEMQKIKQVLVKRPEYSPWFE